MYEISVSEEARIKNWFEGELEEILRLRSLNVIPTVNSDLADFEMKETKKFEVKRPDADGSLDWP